jgi:hypothetical protein
MASAIAIGSGTAVSFYADGMVVQPANSAVQLGTNIALGPMTNLSLTITSTALTAASINLQLANATASGPVLISASSFVTTNASLGSSANIGCFGVRHHNLNVWQQPAICRWRMCRWWSA